jgi:DNA mismatch repair ATPase MutS
VEHPVANCIEETRSVLLTGSNASGKSTFLKTVAINGILAQTVHTSMAASCKTGFYRVMSSMALKDNLETGESYYMVEIRSLKRIMTEAVRETAAPVMCFVDEVLRGTNTVERVAASSRILQSLARDGAFVFAATHDIELTHLLEKEYANYHFREEVLDNDISFNYILNKGRATTRNAIKLLGIMGYDEDVIRKAEETATHFLETGEWRM